MLICLNTVMCFGMAGFDPNRTAVLNMLDLDHQGIFVILIYNSSSSTNHEDAKWKTMFR